MEKIDWSFSQKSQHFTKNESRRDIFRLIGGTNFGRSRMFIWNNQALGTIGLTKKWVDLIQHNYVGLIFILKADDVTMSKSHWENGIQPNKWINKETDN